MEKNGGSGISYSATLLESKEFWQQVEEKEGLEGGDGSRANEFSNFVSSRLSSITTRPGIFGAISPLSLSRAIEKDGKGSKVALVPPLMELHRWWLYTDTEPAGSGTCFRVSCSRKSDASKSILALLVSREIDQI